MVSTDAILTSVIEIPDNEFINTNIKRPTTIVHWVNVSKTDNKYKTTSGANVIIYNVQTIVLNTAC